MQSVVQSELSRLQERQRERLQAREDRLATTAAHAAAAAARAAPAAALASVEAEAAAAAEEEAAVALPVLAVEAAEKEAERAAGEPEHCRDGSLVFRFDGGAEADAAGAPAPTALDLAKQRLASLLPAEAAAGLERQLALMSEHAARRTAPELLPSIVPVPAGELGPRRSLVAKLQGLKAEAAAASRKAAKAAADLESFVHSGERRAGRWLSGG